METDTCKIIEVLRKALIGSYYTKFCYGITYFEFELFNDDLGITANAIISDFELEDKNEWNKLLATYPFSIENLCGPEEPLRGFFMTLLTQVSINNIELESGGTLIFEFRNNIRIRLKGEVEIEDVSWSIEFRNEQGQTIGNCRCSFNEMYLSNSEALLKKVG
ncbi:hypothetical protein HNQ93_001783 [Hymenobacter luteus]|uniref:Uncharacterized protein n=2 Tax=Hymenobacter TaxID=89966 RepID=A0A7W9SZS1_9BACT|nr:MULTISPECIES: hypothetical protein [Hymenobacter]MBB4600856.1 hypothetical protein [Hymenobacter latericoloratus]MBB6058937.1 hypothetical protein [Hymenobacter luteus]